MLSNHHDYRLGHSQAPNATPRLGSSRDFPIQGEVEGRYNLLIESSVTKGGVANYAMTTDLLNAVNC